MAKHGYLCRVVLDTTPRHGMPDGLGWSISCHDEIRAQGGEYEIHGYWSGAPRAIGAIGFNGIAVIDVLDDAVLTHVIRLPSSITNKSDLLHKLRTTPCSALPAAWQIRLNNAGLDTSGTVAQALRDLID